MSPSVKRQILKKGPAARCIYLGSYPKKKYIKKLYKQPQYPWMSWIGKPAKSHNCQSCSGSSHRSQLSCPHKCKWVFWREVCSSLAAEFEWIVPQQQQQQQWQSLMVCLIRIIAASRLCAFCPWRPEPWLEVMEAIKGREPSTFVCGRAPFICQIFDVGS